MTTTEKGNLTELKIAVRLLELGRVVLKAIGEGCRYDLLVDELGKFTRIQCKTGWVRNGVIQFNAVSHYNWKTRRPRYIGQADSFGVYCPDTDGIYFVPVGVVTSDRGCLRLVPSKNGQKKGILLAKDFEAPKV